MAVVNRKFKLSQFILQRKLFRSVALAVNVCAAVIIAVLKAVL